MWQIFRATLKGRVVPFVLAEVNGRAVGIQALIPIAMIDAKEVFWTAKLEETLVDPAYRGSRVFIQMYEKLFRYAEEHGLVSIWGFTPCSLFRRVHCKVGRLGHRTYCDGDRNPVRDSGRC